jgi:adenylylsulfate kinase-like enzyme
MHRKRDKKKGILFWITGLPGSGKTNIARKINNQIKNLYGPTLFVNGDDLRNIFSLKKYDKKSRLAYSKQYCKFAKFITNQNINLVFAIVGMMHEPRNWNRKNIQNYLEIYIKSDIKKIIKKNKKKLYKNKTNNLVGLDIKPQFPKKPDITILNNFDDSINTLSKNLINKIKLKIKI